MLYVVIRDNENRSLDLKWQFEGHKLGVISVDIEHKQGKCKLCCLRILYLNSLKVIYIYTQMYVVQYI